MDQLAKLYGFASPSNAAELERQTSPVRVGDADLPPGTTTVPLGGGRWRVMGPDGAEIGTLVPGGGNGKFQPNGTTIAPGTAAQARSAATPSGPDLSAFTTSPDYQFNLQQGQQAIDRSLAARGRALSGAGVKEGERFASGVASTEYGNYVNRLMTAAGLGNSATQSTAAAGATAANNNSAALLGAANTRASAYMAQGEGVNNAVQGTVSNYLLQQYMNKPPASYGTPPYSPTGTTYPQQTGWSGPR